MGIYIKGMEMPDSCDVCKFSDWSNLHQTACCKILEYKPCFNDFSSEYKTRISDLCPLVEVPEPHGEALAISALQAQDIPDTNVGKIDRYGYIGIETLLNFCDNSKYHAVAVTPNDFMRMKRVRMPEPCEDAVSRKAAVDAIKTTHAVNEWISCATGLMPENGQKVWVSTVKHNVEPALYIPEIMRNDYVWEGEFSYLRKDEVLAWMPYTMPEPYMEDNDGNIE